MEQHRAELSIIICVLNMAKLLPRQLEAVSRQSISAPFEVVIVDNGSSDGSRVIAEEYSTRFSHFRLVEAPHRGLNLARNAGIRDAQSDIVAMCDADDQVQSDWAESLLSAFVPGCYVGGALLHAGTNSYSVRRRWGVENEGPRVPDFVFRGAPSPAGGNCCFSKSMWLDVGGFDERLSGAGDELEFFARANAAGYDYIRAPQAVVSYHYPDSALSVWRRGYRYGYHGRLAVARSAPSADNYRHNWRLRLSLMVALARALLGVIARRRGIYRWLHLAGKRTGELAYELSSTWRHRFGRIVAV